jgi:single-stranded-DNA-specific exonuclease
MVEIMVDTIDTKLDASAILKEILLKRGISSDEETSEFLSEKPKLTHDPFLLKDMEKAVIVILSAIQLKKNICIYGDYDSDGVTAICLLYEFLGALTDKISYYIPSRFDEGYGLNNAAIKKLALKGCELLITVDCGSISFDEVEFGKKLGLEIIVTDHHNINSKPADCLLINPKQEECNYPFKDLSGCGIAFKLAQGIQRKLNLEKSTVNRLLDLVAIATIGDIVPLIEENRTLVKYGISSINEGKRKGLRHLALACNITDERIKSEQIAYAIVPHINAAGRMHLAETAVRLLISDRENDITEQSNKLLNYNIDRKKIQEDIFVKCLEIIRLQGEIPKFIVVNSGDSHEGILGIVAGKIKERYKRPTIIVCNTAEKGILKGTGRGTEGVDLYGMLKENQEIIIKYGGHKGACGFLIEETHLEELSINLNRYMGNLEEANINSLDNEHEFDYDINLESIDSNLLNMLEKLEPYGYKNEKPIFLIKNIRIKSVNFMGTKSQHARFFVTNEKLTLECLLFNFSEKDRSLLVEGESIQVFGYLDFNCWNGNKKIQFMAKEIKPND